MPVPLPGSLNQEGQELRETWFDRNERQNKLGKSLKPEKDDWFSEQMRSRQKLLNLSLVQGNEIDPGVAAELVRLQGVTGLRPEILLPRLKEFQAEEQMWRLHPETFHRRSPVLANMLQQSWAFAGLTKEQIQNYEGLERILSLEVDQYPMPPEMVERLSVASASRRAEALFGTADNPKNPFAQGADETLLNEFNIPRNKHEAYAQFLKEELVDRKFIEEVISGDAPIGAWETLKVKFHENPLFMVPYISGLPEIERMTVLWKAAKAVEAGEDTEGDRDLLVQYGRLATAMERRGTSVFGTTAEIMASSVTFAIEMGTTGGIYSGTKQAILKTGKETAEHLIRNSVKKVLRGRVGAALGASLVQTAITSPARVPQGILRRLSPDIQLDIRNGDMIPVAIPDSAEGLGIAVYKEVFSQWTELVSEKFGGTGFGLALDRKANKVLFGAWKSSRKARGASATAEAFQSVLKKGGIQGVFSEFAEERLADLMRMVGGVQPFQLGDVVPEFLGGTLPNDQVYAEFLAFGLMQAPGVALNRFGRRQQDTSHNKVILQKVNKIAQELKKAGQPQEIIDLVVTEMTKENQLGQVYIPVEKVTEFYQDKKDEAGNPIEARDVVGQLTGNPLDYDDAVKTGAAIPVNMGRYAAIVAAQEDSAEFFQEEARLEPMRESTSEEEVRQERQVEALAELEEEVVPEIEEPREKIRDIEAKMFKLMVDADFDPVAAQAVAALQGAFFGETVMGELVDPIEQFAKGNLVIERFQGKAAADKILEARRLAALPENTGRPQVTRDQAELIKKVAAAGADGATPETLSETYQIQKDLTPELQELADAELIDTVNVPLEGRVQQIFKAKPEVEVPEINEFMQAAVNNPVEGFDVISPFLKPSEKAKLRKDTTARLLNLWKALPKTADFADAATAAVVKKGWYENSAKALRQIFGETDAPRFAALLGATSPKSSIESNLRNSLSIWINWDKAGRPTQKAKIVRIMAKSVEGERGVESILPSWIPNTVKALGSNDAQAITLSGPKVNSFMLNLRDVVDEVTNDVWIANFALVNQAIFAGELNVAGTEPGKGPGYLAVSAKIRAAAALLTERTKVEWTPAEVQETIWSWAKTALELADAAGEGRTVQELVKEGAITDAALAATPDFQKLFSEDASIRAMLEAAGYGDQINTIQAELGGPTPAGVPAPGEAVEGAPGEVTPGLLRSARRLDRLRAARAGGRARTLEAKRRREEAGPEEGEREVRELEGLPEDSPGPAADIRVIAQRYLAQQKIPIRQQKVYARVDIKRAEQIADEFEKMKHDPKDPETAAAYQALSRETILQFQAFKELGVEVEAIKPGQKNPYRSSQEMIEDVRKGHIWFFPTDQGFGTETEIRDNPLLAPTNEVLDGKPLLVNDLFRIIHDVFGHAKEGVSFGPQGEENAWQAHVRMFSPLAARAMTSETRGQNSWVNYGPFGEANRKDKTATTFADQKTGLLPNWVLIEGLVEDVEEGPGSKELFQDAFDQPAGKRDRPKRGRIRINGEEFSIDLFKNADQTTVLHELGHQFLEILGKLAVRGEVSKKLSADFQIIMDAVEIKDAATWSGMSLDSRRVAHEKFADMFEQYLMTGNAPSSKLRNAFRRFKSWLTQIYRSLVGFSAPLTPEVKEVFDRMLASKEEIAVAQVQQHFHPLHQRIDAMPFTQSKKDKYKRLFTDVGDEAEEKMLTAWLKDTKASMDQRLRAERKRFEGQTRGALGSEKVYAALFNIQKGKFPDGAKLPEGTQIKLNTDAVRREIPEDLQRIMPGGLLSPNGLHPDHAAEIFGFGSGVQMLRAMAEAKDFEATVKEIVDQQMHETHADFKTEMDLAEEAQRVIHSESRSELALLEMEILVSEEFAQFKELARKIVRPLPKVEVIRKEAERFVFQRSWRDNQPHVWQRAEKEASRKAHEAFLKGEWDEAFNHKLTQLVANERYRAARKMRAQAESWAKWASRFGRESVRAKFGKLDAAGTDFLDQIDSILNRFSFEAGVSEREIDRRRKTLKEWSEAEAKRTDNEPVVAEKLFTENWRQPWKEVSFEDLTSIIDLLVNIDHLANFETQLGAAVEFKELNEAIDRFDVGIVKNSPGKRDVELERRPANEAPRGIESFLASHRNLANFFWEMDGWKDGGIAWELFVRPVNRAADREASMKAQSAQDLEKIFSVYSNQELKTLYDKKEIPELGTSLSRSALLTMALNWGTEDNATKLVAGLGSSLDRTVTAEQVQRVLMNPENLNEKDWKFVVSVWDYVETFKKESFAMHKRTTGLDLREIEGREITTPFGVIQGKYYRLKYDDRQSDKAHANQISEAALDAKRGAASRATTRHGSRKARVEGVTQPIRLDMGVLYEHVGETIHDQTHYEMLLDMKKLLDNVRVKKLIREHYGDVTIKMIKAAVEDIATGDQPATTAFEKGINWLRQGSSIAAMGWNVMTAFLQPYGLTQSFVRVGTKWVGKGMSRYFADMPDTVKWVNSRSEFMTNRPRTQMREINEIMNSTIKKGRGSIWIDWLVESATTQDLKLSKIGQSYFWLITRFQMIADYPTWIGAYEKAMDASLNNVEGSKAQTAGGLKSSAEKEKMEQRASDLADQAVRDSQGSGHISDLAQIQRGTPLMKLWTNFYSYFAKTYGLAFASVKRTKTQYRRKELQEGDIGRLAVDFLMLYFVPATLSALMRILLKGDAPEEGLGVKLVRENLSYLLGSMVGVREISGAVAGFYGYEGPAGTRMFSEFSGLVTQLAQGEADVALFRALNNTAGVFLHYPAGQAAKTADGFASIMSGDSLNPFHLVTGAPREKKESR